MRTKRPRASKQVPKESALQGKSRTTPAPTMEQTGPFINVNVASQAFTVRKSDFRIRILDIFRASDKPREELPKIQREFPGRFDLDYSFKHRGIYIDFWVGVELSRRYGLIELEKELHTWNAPQKVVGEDPRYLEPKAPQEFIEVTGFSNAIMVRILDFRVNASHIFRLAGKSRAILENYRNTLKIENYDILRGHSKHQGTYVDFDIAIELCQTYGLLSLGNQLRTMRPTPLPAEAIVVPTLAADAQSTDPVATDSDSTRMIISDDSQSTSRKPRNLNNTHPTREDTDPLPPDGSYRYEASDSQPQLSRLSEVKPSKLGPSSWKTTSHYGESFSDLFALGWPRGSEWQT
ncbi:MAG: hypothetical protein Q9166_007683 [cf. Caloplaca sp. 2 TL-2023]